MIEMLQKQNTIQQHYKPQPPKQLNQQQSAISTYSKEMLIKPFQVDLGQNCCFNMHLFSRVSLMTCQVTVGRPFILSALTTDCMALTADTVSRHDS